MITSEIEAKLIIDVIIVSINNNISIIIFSTFLNDVVFNIVTNILQIGRTNEVVIMM